MSMTCRSVMMLKSGHVLTKTLHILFIFFCCDVFNILCGLAFFSCGTWTSDQSVNKAGWITVGKTMAVFFLVSGICNRVARYGVKVWCRVFLAPYLIFLLMVMSSLLINLGKSVTFQGLKETDLLSILAVLITFYIWQVILRQWVYMSLPKPVLSDEESPAVNTADAGIVLTTEAQTTQVDPPPNYDSLESADTNTSGLPDYQEVTGGQELAK